MSDLIKITVLGELKNPIFYNPVSGNLERHRIFDSRGCRYKAPFVKTIWHKNTDGYPVISGDGKIYTHHRLIMWQMHGILSSHDVQINHIDGDKTNNRLNNLEFTSNADNVRHAKRSSKSSGLPNNVCWDKNRNLYTVSGRFEGRKLCNFGRYTSLEDATTAAKRVQEYQRLGYKSHEIDDSLFLSGSFNSQRKVSK